MPDITSLASRTATELGIETATADRLVTALRSVIRDALAQGSILEIPAFGRLYPDGGTALFDPADAARPGGTEDVA